MKSNEVLATLILGGIAAGILGILLWGVPAYKVYTAEQEGRAILAKAEYSRKAQIEDAKAKKESAQYLTEAAKEIQGVLTPEYIAYLRIQAQEEIARETTDKEGNVVYFLDSGLNTAPTIPVNK